MPNIGPLELVIILVIALLILGPGKLPEVGASLGKSIREFRKASSDVQEAVKVNVDTTPLPARRLSRAGRPAPRLRRARAPGRGRRRAIAAAVAAATAESAPAAPRPPTADPTTVAK